MAFALADPTVRARAQAASAGRRWMFLTRKRAFARAGLLGNPSDGYHGKTVSFSVRNYWAEVALYEWDSVEIVLAADDRAQFDSVFDLARDVRLHGYYGGIRLIKATIKRFVEHCQARGRGAARPEVLGALPDDDSAAGRPRRLERDHRRHAALPDGVLRRAAAARDAADVRAARRAGGAGHHRRSAGSGDSGLRGARLHGLRSELRAPRRRPAAATATSRWTRRCCRRSTSRITRRSASRPRCFTTISASASIAAIRPWWGR